MKEVEFGGVEISGFKCFGEKVFLPLDGDPGLYFMFGRNEVEPRLGANGAGKSSVWDAVRWCLYGKGTKGLSSTDIRPWGKKAKTHVTIPLRVGGTEHTITRSLAPNRVLLDGKEVGNEQIEKLLGMSATVFDHTVLLGQGAPLFFDLDPKDKMDLLADVLNMERWELRSERASDKVSKMSKLEKELELEHARQTAALEEVVELIKSTTIRAEGWRGERKGKLANFDEQIDALRKDLEKIERTLGAAELKSDSSGTEAKALRKELGALATKLRTAQAAQARAEAEVNAERQVEQRTRTALNRASEEKKCPACGQPLLKENIKQHQAELRNDLQEAEEALKRAEGLLKAARAETSALGRELAAAEAAAAEFLRTEEQAALTVARLRPEMASIKTRLFDREAQRAELENAINPHNQALSELRRQKNSTELNVEDLASELSKIRTSMEQYKFWVGGFKELRLFEIEEMLQELNLETNAALESLGLINWQVQYDIERETQKGTIKPGLNVSILSPENEKPVRWQCWSGGEAQRLRVAGALALSEVLLNHGGLQVNLEIIDEPTRGLTAGGSRDLYEYLAERAKHINRRTWYIDHLAVQSSAFTASVAVVKTAAGSRFET